MDEQQLPKAGPETVERKADWTRPEVEKLIAGGAEAADGADVDGTDLQS